MTNERILEAIEGLLKKANDKGATKDEAIQAGKMAQKLMKKYKIKELNFSKTTNEIINNYIVIRNRTWKTVLLGVVAKNFCCRDYTSEELNTKTLKFEKVAHFYGLDTDVQVAIKVFKFLHDAIIQGIAKEKKKAVSIYGTSVGVEKAYALGFIVAVKRELQSNCRALALVIPKEVNDKYNEELGGKLKTYNIDLSINNNNSAAESFHNGIKDGTEIAKKKELK